MDMLRFYKCLADDTRLNLLLLLSAHEELCVCDLVESLALSQPKVSRHLAHLREHGLLEDRRQGQWVYYRLHAALPAWCREVLAQTLAAAHDGTDRASATPMIFPLRASAGRSADISAGRSACD